MWRWNHDSRRKRSNVEHATAAKELETSRRENNVPSPRRAFYSGLLSLQPTDPHHLHLVGGEKKGSMSCFRWKPLSVTGAFHDDYSKLLGRTHTQREHYCYRKIKASSCSPLLRWVVRTVIIYPPFFSGSPLNSSKTLARHAVTAFYLAPFQADALKNRDRSVWRVWNKSRPPAALRGRTWKRRETGIHLGDGETRRRLTRCTPCSQKPFSAESAITCCHRSQPQRREVHIPHGREGLAPPTCSLLPHQKVLFLEFARVLKHTEQIRRLRSPPPPPPLSTPPQPHLRHGFSNDVIGQEDCFL